MGRSDVPRGPYTVRQMARDARAVLDGAGVAERADVVGASMGGMIAQELALRWPERVGRLVLACTTSRPLLGKWPEFGFGPRGGARWVRQTRDERERALRSLLYADGTAEERIEEDLRVRCGCAWCYKGFLNQLAGILAWSAHGRLHRVKAPTLVLHGDQDRLVPPENGRALAARIPGARFELIRDAGHVMVTDQPEECVRRVREFLG